MYSLIGLILVCIFFLPIVYNSYVAAPPVPTLKKDVDRMIDFARIKDGETVYDLGAGDGRLVIATAKRTRAKSIIGYELSPIHFFVCRLRIVLNKFSGRVQIKFQDFFKTELDHVDVILCFLTPKALDRLLPQFRRHIASGGRIITYLFPIEALEPTQTSRPTENDLPIFLYSN